MKKFWKTHPPITKAIIFFHTLFAQHISTLNWVLFVCYFTTELIIKYFFFLQEWKSTFKSSSDEWRTRIRRWSQSQVGHLKILAYECLLDICCLFYFRPGFFLFNQVSLSNFYFLPIFIFHQLLLFYQLLRFDQLILFDQLLLITNVYFFANLYFFTNFYLYQLLLFDQIILFDKLKLFDRTFFWAS
jgi:hypothetical protein